MPRLFVLLLALLLPLQFAWGAAASYCAHETSPQVAAHLGHHEHAHEGHDTGPAKPAGAKVLPDTDCGVCNAPAPHALWDGAFALPGLPATALQNEAPASRIRSAHARVPDRPQWPRLA